MSRKVVLELRDDNCLYDADNVLVISALNMNYKYFEPEKSNAKSTLELVKLGVSVDEIIKLKNMDLI